MYDIIISGYYGFNNSGDEALLYSIIQDLRACKPDIKIAVLSQNPAQTSANYQVDAIERLKLFQVFRTMRPSSLKRRRQPDSGRNQFKVALLLSADYPACKVERSEGNAVCKRRRPCGT